MGRDPRALFFLPLKIALRIWSDPESCDRQFMELPMTAAMTTVDHDTIRNWVEARKGRPARVKDATEGGGGLLRIDFGKPEDALEKISWDEFFKIFDEENLAFLHQDMTDDGQTSRFCKFIHRH
jgi:hypothetical protein